MTGEFVSCVWEKAFKNLFVSSSILSVFPNVHPFSTGFSSLPAALFWFNSQMWHWNALIAASFFVAISFGTVLNIDNNAISRFEECLKQTEAIFKGFTNLAITKNRSILFAEINSRTLRPFKRIVGPKFSEQFSIRINSFRCPFAEMNSR